MVNRNDDAVVATGVGGVFVFGGSHSKGEFRQGYGQSVRSGRYLRAGERARAHRSAAGVRA
jgi:N-acyl-D-aspartate/D-glutamate deacylase